MTAHPRLGPNSSLAEIWLACSRWQAAVPPLEERVDALFAARNPLPIEKVNTTVEEALAEMPEEVEWNELLHQLDRLRFEEFNGMYRRISQRLPLSKQTGASYLHWAAAEVFFRRDPDMLSEVAENYCRLDLESYDADGLSHLKNYLLAAGKPQIALHLLEHFWPITKSDKELMHWVESERATEIIQLRMGLFRLNPSHAGTPTPELLNQIGKGLRRYFVPKYLMVALDILWGRAAEPAWERDHLGLIPSQRKPKGDWDDETDSRGKKKSRTRFNEPLVSFPQWAHLDIKPLWIVLRFAELWGFQQDSAGAALLPLVDGLFYVEFLNWIDDLENETNNAIELLLSAHLEEFVVQSCRGLIGIDAARAILLMTALRNLSGFLEARRLLTESKAIKANRELARLDEALLKLVKASED